jgi:hypothetical protein
MTCLTCERVSVNVRWRPPLTAVFGRRNQGDRRFRASSSRTTAASLRPMPFLRCDGLDGDTTSRYHQEVPVRGASQPLSCPARRRRAWNATSLIRNRDSMNNLNTAQQVRIWVSVGISIILALSVFGMLGSLASVSDYNGNGSSALVTTQPDGFYAWFYLAFVILAALGVLAVSPYSGCTSRFLQCSHARPAW